VYERFEIPAIRESYRPVPETRTVVMPLLIALVAAGLGVFFVKSRPQPHSFASPNEIGPPADDETIPMLRAVPIDWDEVDSDEAAGPFPETTEAGESDFTPWMSLLALDTYIRQKNRGFEETFWERGNGIRAIEGRWRNGAHEFRIAFARHQKAGGMQWLYRIDQTPAKFEESNSRFAAEGFTLIQSHSYEHPDGNPRYQGVWRKENSTEVRSTRPQGFVGAVSEIP
jgi:hypothetical protein